MDCFIRHYLEMYNYTSCNFVKINVAIVSYSDVFVVVFARELVE